LVDMLYEMDQPNKRILQERDALRGSADDLHAQVMRQVEMIAQLRGLVERYRKETPLGNQPHMIAHLADAALEESAVHNAELRGRPLADGPA
jgi:hypothetical protein